MAIATKFSSNIRGLFKLRQGILLSNFNRLAGESRKP